MAVIIGKECINCDACRQQCPVGAIADDAHNPTGETRYYVHPEKCVECVDIYEDPQCASICPSIGTITWDLAFIRQNNTHFLDENLYRLNTRKGVLLTPAQREKPYRSDIPNHWRSTGKLVEEAPGEAAS